jgi:hypothetical protein
VDISVGETIPGISTNLDATQNLIRQYLSALELDFSDPLSADLSIKRIMNRLYELQGLLTGINRASEIVERVGEDLEGLLNDKLKSFFSSRSPGGDSNNGDFIYEILRAIQERLGLYDPNNPDDATDTFDPNNDLRTALGELLQTQMGSGESFSPQPSATPLVGPARSATPVFEDPSQQRARGLPSREAVVREVGRAMEDVTDKEKEIEKIKNDRGKG